MSSERAPGRPAPTSKAAPEPAGKVLRVCVLTAGVLRDERRFRRREAVSVGSQPDCTFVLAPDGDPPAHQVVFAPHEGHWELCVEPAMAGTVAQAGHSEPATLAALRERGALVRRGPRTVLPLGEGHRGSVTLGPVTLTFQFVDPPAVAPADALPRLPLRLRYASLDRLFVACCLLIATLEVGLVIFLRRQPHPKAITLETMDDRFAKLIVPDRPPGKKALPPPPPSEAAPPQKAAPQHAAPSVAPRATRPARPPPPAEGDAAKAARRAKLRASIGNRGLLAVLGTAGAGSAAGGVADLLGEGKVTGDLDHAFEGVSGVGVADGSAPRATSRGGAAGREAGAAGLRTGGAGKVGSEQKQEAAVGKVEAGEAEVDGALDAAQISKVVQSRMRMVQDCYERELKRSPGLAGKVEIEFTIGEDGRVEAAKVVRNGLGSDAVGECIVGRIKTWRFPKPDGGSVTVTFPFIFAPSA